MKIYHQMKINWETYCLMSSIIYIEEMSKPTENIQIKKYKEKEYTCLCFHSIRLKMKDPEFINYFFNTTSKWQKTKKIQLLGKKMIKPLKEKDSLQDLFYLSPMWINMILSEIGTIPNDYSLKTAIKRIQNFKQYKSKKINLEKMKLNKLLTNKFLAAGAFIVSMDLEFRGAQSGKLSLCMSEKYKDFLEFMLTIAKKWDWTRNNTLSKVNIEHSIKRRIRASPQYELRLSMKGLKEIYALAGPLINSQKNKCISFNVTRSKDYKNLGGKNRLNKTREKIISYIENNPDTTTTNLQFITNTGTDVVLDHLNDLNKKGKVIKTRKGKRFTWRLKE